PPTAPGRYSARFVAVGAVRLRKPAAAAGCGNCGGPAPGPFEPALLLLSAYAPRTAGLVETELSLTLERSLSGHRHTEGASRYMSASELRRYWVQYRLESARSRHDA